MKHVIFSTGNADKFRTATDVCAEVGIELEQRDLDIVEIQSEDAEAIALDKASKAFALVQQPVAITDDSWHFTGLRGFPGAYMKSMNHWLTADDFLRLAEPLKNREVILSQRLAYTDGMTTKVFHSETKGSLLHEKRGTYSQAVFTVVAFDEDNGQSIAEVYTSGGNKSRRGSARIWHDFAMWYLNHP